ncbi:hypothetical protein B0F90DRAFT_1817135 [Multifurca ochricompacta]|uniref:Uncharacterized protein n=1 Tax=Multifurca ochricompacta TaxID=376703 RepID=A0AAD4M668_9AGAM|nr:hypothetical protein B0F90DRAFT_1817135 [Multifurca ochricompacta]
MSVHHSNHSQSQSLPPFAVAFSNSSLDRLSSHPTSLPPIQPRLPSERPRSLPEASQAPAMSESTPIPNGRKRSHPDVSQRDDNSPDNRATNSTSPHLARVKMEHDDHGDDSHSQSRPSRPHPPHPQQDPDSRSMPPSAPSPQSQPSPKKRRMTVSGPSHLTDQVTSFNPTNSGTKAASPPIVIGMPSLARDDPNAVEQVRSMLTVKRNQEALIEKRRGSLGGSLPSSSQSSLSSAAVKPLPGSSRNSARSPNMSVARTTRTAEAPLNPSGPAPVPTSGQNQQTDLGTHPPPIHNSLPPPPISFAGRRAFKSPSSLRKKPADIVISPRDSRTQPVIQSAPAQQGGRFPPMALPSLPNVQQPPSGRRIPGNVPPTPTRLTLRSSFAAPSSTSSLAPPPPASVPISTVLIPQTPVLLNRADSASQRNAFLAPFEAFYDALRDAKELKTWLAEQLAKAQALQTGFDAAVDAAVERRVGGLREEVARLQRRVEELESARGVEETGSVRWRRSSIANGDLAMPAASTDNAQLRESYTFPPVQARGEEGTAGDDSDMRETDSPAPAFDVRRQSISAVRMDPPPPQSQQQVDVHNSLSVKSPPLSRGAARRPSYQQLQPPAQPSTSQPGSPMEAS